ncbi:hypothetical protein PL8927_600230 [Planktothrix serta PCC 8927]|uniref:PIN domain-containing protein n=1 Tax=Planktothrix serta PCC 8927 TaxID=671068 RepID=A0A7Z9BR63_9CYAN|nr:putative toxin-antitoxin system toxin component, PIN family [Planktothrix serta]VXD18039.1 hypothetical protein PL8927_600230 [Planktothrix serta PCC 8927]
MKIIIDTNVLISATIADGKPEHTIDFIVASDDWDWIVSEAILHEYRQVLNRPKLKLSDPVKQKWLDIVKEATIKINVEEVGSFQDLTLNENPELCYKFLPVYLQEYLGVLP